MSVCVILVPALGDLHSLNVMVVVLSYHILSAMFGCYLLETYSFLIRDRGVDPERRRNGESLGGREGRESVIQVHCMRKESIFNKQQILIIQKKITCLLIFLSLVLCNGR